MTSRPTLTQDTVVDAALALGDAEGIDAVTIRRLARELGVTPMALYWHFKTKELLFVGMIHRVMGPVAIDTAEPDWRAGIRRQVEALIAQLRAHPCMPALFQMTDKYRAENFARATETALTFLTRGGFTIERANQVAVYLLDGARSLVAAQPGCPAWLDPAEHPEWRRQSKLRLQAFPAAEFPRLVELSETATDDPDLAAYYAFGMNLLLSGVAGMAEPTTR